MKTPKNSTPFKVMETRDKNPAKGAISEPGADLKNTGRPTSLLFENAPVGLYVVENGVLIRVASWLADLLGYEKPEDLANKPFEEILHPDDRGKTKEELAFGENQSGSMQLNVRVLKKDGSFLWMSLRESLLAGMIKT